MISTYFSSLTNVNQANTSSTLSKFHHYKMSPVSLLFSMVTLLIMTQPGKFWLKVELRKI